jgi:hypothetical protein
MRAATVAARSAAASRSMGSGGPSTLTGWAARCQPSALVSLSTERIAPVVSSLPCTTSRRAGPGSRPGRPGAAGRRARPRRAAAPRASAAPPEHALGRVICEEHHVRAHECLRTAYAAGGYERSSPQCRRHRHRGGAAGPTPTGPVESAPRHERPSRRGAGEAEAGGSPAGRPAPRPCRPAVRHRRRPPMRRRSPRWESPAIAVGTRPSASRGPRDRAWPRRPPLVLPPE